MRKKLKEGDYDLVLWAGGGGAAGLALSDEAAKNPDTHFVFVDDDLTGTSLEGQANATALAFDSGGAAQLAGYLGALMESRKSSAADGRKAVSVVGGIPVPQVTTLVNGFANGARKAGGVRVLVGFSDNFIDQPFCEQIANRQIDRGSGVVFAAAGDCGTGALAAAGIRGVWGVGADRDQSYLGPHILASVVKRFDRAVELAVRRHFDGSLPPGKTLELGIAEDVVGLVGISPEVPAGIRKRVAQEAARLRAEQAAQRP